MRMDITHYRMAAFILVVLLMSGCWHMLTEHSPMEHTTLKETDISVASNPVETALKSAVNWNSVFDFLPLGAPSCTETDTSPQSKINFTLPKNYWDLAKEHSKRLDQTFKELNSTDLEGHSGTLLYQTAVYMKLASLPFVKTICETGFNAGHSTVTWLTASNTTHIYSFDLGYHQYAQTMADYLQKAFPGRLTLTWGDSTKTIPQFHVDHPNVVCDLIIIDGGHFTHIATEDFDNFRNMASEDNIVVFDDYPTDNFKMNKELGRMWEIKKRKQEVMDIFHCMFRNRGFSIGRMLF